MFALGILIGLALGIAGSFVFSVVRSFCRVDWFESAAGAPRR